MTGPDEPQRRALTALSFLADPGDRVLGGLLRFRTTTEVLAAITAPEVPPRAIMTASRDVPGLAGAFGRWRARLKLLPTQAQLAAWEQGGLRLIMAGDPEWPAQLDDLGDARPLLLWVSGSIDLRYACLASVSMVGPARRPATACTWAPRWLPRSLSAASPWSRAAPTVSTAPRTAARWPPAG